MIVEKKYLSLKEHFTTEDGFVFKKPVAAYEEYGQADGPVVVMCHGGLSSPHAAGIYKDNNTLGWYDALTVSYTHLDVYKRQRSSYCNKICFRGS